MNEKPVKVDINFQEALRRIARAPKDSVVNKQLVNEDLKNYNQGNSDAKSSKQSKKVV